MVNGPVVYTVRKVLRFASIKDISLDITFEQAIELLKYP